MSNKTKEEMAREYAETFRFDPISLGWFMEKTLDFLAGYDSRQAEIETLTARILELEAMLEVSELNVKDVIETKDIIIHELKQKI